MKTISLNGKWKCKPDIENLGIEKEGIIQKITIYVIII